MANIQHILDTTGLERVHTYTYSFGGSTLGFAIAIEPEWFGQRLHEATLVASPMSLARTRSVVLSLLGI